MIVLVTCSGVSNTGKLTTQAAIALMQKWPGRFLWTHVRKSAASLEDEVRGADRVVVIDGCHDCCAIKKLIGVSDIPNHHIIATDLGIEKNGMADVKYAEIERVVAAVHTILSGD
ncbi:MAG: putative zinc-binding protein [Methanoregula sp.]